MAFRPAGRLVSLALVGLGALSGCHTAGVGGLSTRPEPTLPKASLTANEAIQQHNINASRLQSFVASPRIKVTSPGVTGAADGRMALERPKNFKLLMYSPAHTSTIADIGSNEEEFWFWTKDKKDNSVYVCSYEDLERTPISAAFQPDWVVEALGLKTISRDEASGIVSKPGPAYGTIELTSNRRGGNGEVLTKKTIIDPSGRIKEHRLYSNGGKTLLAQAVVTEYSQFSPKAVAGEKAGEPVYLPKEFRLQWVPEQLTLDVSMHSVTINEAVTDEDRQARFSEPRPPGTKRQNLAELAPPSSRPSTPTRAEADEPLNLPRSRTSRGMPPSGVTGSRPRDESAGIVPDVQLGAPEPLSAEGANRKGRDPLSLSPDLSDGAPAVSRLDSVVRPSVPTGSQR